MPRNHERPTIKVTHRLWKADYEVLQEMARLQGVQANTLLREMLHSYIVQTQALARKNLDRLPPPPAFSMDELSDQMETQP